MKLEDLEKHLDLLKQVTIHTNHFDCDQFKKLDCFDNQNIFPYTSFLEELP